MKEYKKLAEAQIGDNFTRPLLIDSIKTEIASNGNPFLKIAVTDGETMQSIVLFDTAIEALAAQGIKADILADIDLMVESYRGNKSFKIVSMKPTDDPDADIKDYIKLPPVDIDLMYNEIIEKIKGAAQTFEGKYEPLADLTVSILKKYEEGYKRSSAAISMHHNLRGGLLYHSYRMVLAAEVLCTVYTLLDKELLICGAAIHDIGKLKVPRAILEKNGRLTDEEFNIIKEHPYFTRLILMGVDGFGKIADWAGFHHEKLNGRGYPFGFGADELDLGSRIMAVADIFSAITEVRPYRDGMPKEQAIKVMRENVSSGAICGDITALLLDHYDEVDEARSSASREAGKRYFESLKQR